MARANKFIINGQFTEKDAIDRISFYGPKAWNYRTGKHVHLTDRLGLYLMFKGVLGGLFPTIPATWIANGILLISSATEAIIECEGTEDFAFEEAPSNYPIELAKGCILIFGKDMYIEQMKFIDTYKREIYETPAKFDPNLDEFDNPKIPPHWRNKPSDYHDPNDGPDIDFGLGDDGKKED